MMAEAKARAGHFAATERLLDQALEISAYAGGVWFDAELHRLKGEFRLMQSVPDHRTAETAFRQAIAIAQGQSAKLWELRAVTSLARLWITESRRGQARELLAPVRPWFANGTETADTNDAAALLAQLG